MVSRESRRRVIRRSKSFLFVLVVNDPIQRCSPDALHELGKLLHPSRARLHLI